MVSPRQLVKKKIQGMESIYEIKEVIGRGGYGIVRKVVHKQL
jgi:serine/threonine protein kinase